MTGLSGAGEQASGNRSKKQQLEAGGHRDPWTMEAVLGAAAVHAPWRPRLQRRPHAAGLVLQ